MTTRRMNFTANNNRSHQDTQAPRKSPRRLYPAFLKVAKAESYAPACAATYRLAGALLKIGQAPAVIIHDLALLNGAGLPPLLVAEIVTAASMTGGQK